MFKENPGWVVIDVSGRAIEETSAIILEMYKDRDMTRQSRAHPL
jgi:regulator of PEP synthase PpsR (kinase-PPPase family)